MTVQILDHNGVLEALCKATGKWGVYIALWGGSGPDGQEEDEIIKAAPYLAGPYDGDEGNAKSQILIEGSGIILCDSEAEMLRYFHMTIGDDGPNKFNPYNGDARVYAMTCDPTGMLLSENT